MTIHDPHLDRDGVVVLRGALDAADVARVIDVFDHGMAHPGVGAYSVYPETGATFFVDTFNVKNWPVYRTAFTETPIPDHLQRLWGCDDVWFLYEQLFLKEGGEMRRTPWHQDASYLPVAGDHVAVCWIVLDPLDADEALEFVRGSHRGPTYNTSALDPADDTKPLIDDLDLPRLPDVESRRGDYDIVGWAVEPGDVIVFHANLLHGGAPIRSGRRRRTVSFRYFGDDAVFAPQQRTSAGGEATRVAGGFGAAAGGMKPGAPFRHPMFPKVRPLATTAGK